MERTQDETWRLYAAAKLADMIADTCRETASIAADALCDVDSLIA